MLHTVNLVVEQMNLELTNMRLKNSSAYMFKIDWRYHMATSESADPSQYFQGSPGVCSSKTGNPREHSFIPYHDRVLETSLFPFHYEDTGTQGG